MSFSRYVQVTGAFEIFAPADESPNERCIYATVGYAGRGACRNNRSCAAIAGRGPLPRGFYRVCGPVVHPHLGPVAFQLEPFSTNHMHGRSGFWIHGDSRVHPGDASSGCIILSREAREAVALYGVSRLEVVPGP
jgi:hypothetical protein